MGTSRNLLRQFTAAAVLASLLVARAAHGHWLSLPEVVQRARTAAPDVVRARGGVWVAQSAGVGARMSSFGNPYFELYADRRASPDGQGVGVNGILWIPFEIAGQRSFRIAEAGSVLEWQQGVARDSSARAVGAAIAAYGETLVSTSRLVQARLAEEQAQAEMNYFAARALVGDATVVDRSLAEAEVARYAQISAEARIALVRSREQVAVLTASSDLGFPPEDTPAEPPSLQIASPDAQVRAVLGKSPLLDALQNEALYHARARDRAEAERSPPMSGIVTAGRGELGDVHLGAGLAWTIPVIRRNEGEIARELAEEGRARDERTAWKTFLAVRARADVESYQQTIGAIASLDRTGLPAAAKVVDATQSAFQAGKLEMIRLITARRDLAIARARRLDLVEGAWRAYGDLAALRGDLP